MTTIYFLKTCVKATKTEVGLTKVEIKFDCMLIFLDLRYVEQQFLIRVAFNILKETKDLCHT